MVDCATIDHWLAEREAQVPGLKPGCEKSVVWAGQPGVATDWAVLYVHGFSASGHELRPLPDMVAQSLDANLHFTRLRGHGQDGAALAAATFAEWQEDAAEALEIVRSLGKRVVLMGCSTGCTLLTLALANGAQAAGIVHVSPNFQLRHPVAKALVALPGLDPVADLFLRSEQKMAHPHPGHAAYFTTRYPRRAVKPVADAVRAFAQIDVATISVPAFCAVNPEDTVIDPGVAREVMARWGGPAVLHELHQTPDDDPMGHVMAGDIFSPRQTAPLASAIIRWLADI